MSIVAYRIEQKKFMDLHTELGPLPINLSIYIFRLK